MLPFADSMFPDRVLVRHAGDTISPQGGVSSTPGVGTWYSASVQWQTQAALKSNPETPLAEADATIYIPRTGPDPFLSGLARGDQVDVMTAAGDVIVTEVQAPPTGATDPFVAWKVPVRAVQQ